MIHTLNSLLTTTSQKGEKIYFAKTTYEDLRLIYADINDTLLRHANEVDQLAQIKKLDPCLKTYEKMDEIKSLISIVVRTEKTILGFSINLKTPHLHYKNLILLKNDLFFLTKQARRIRVKLGEGLVRLSDVLVAVTENVAKNEGCSVINWGAKPSTPAYNFFCKKGYSVNTIEFWKEL